MEQDYEKTQIASSDATQVFQAPQADATQLAVTLECPVCHTRNAAGEMYCAECGFLLSSKPGEFEAPPADQVGAFLIDNISGREFPIRPGKNTVGRQDADILLTDPSVSRNHAVICDEGGKYTIEDVGSTNGTFIDSQQVSRGDKKELTSGLVLKFGTLSLEFSAPGAPEEPVVEPAMETEVGTDHPEILQAEEGEQVPTPEPAAPEAEEDTTEVAPANVTEAFQVEAVTAEPETVEPTVVEPAIIGKLIGADGAEYQLPEGTSTVGRASSNDVVIADPYTSGRHAQIIASTDEVTVTDLGSTNGTMVNGQPLVRDVPVTLESGASIQFGKQQFTFEKA